MAFQPIILSDVVLAPLLICSSKLPTVWTCTLDISWLLVEVVNFLAVSPLLSLIPLLGFHHHNRYLRLFVYKEKPVLFCLGAFFVCFFGSPFWKFQSAVCGKHHIMVGACGGARCMLEFPIPSRTHPTNLSILHWATYPNGVPSGVILGPDSSRTWSRTEAGCPPLSARILLQKRGDILFCFHTLTSPCFVSFSLPQKLPIFLDGPDLISLALVGLKQPVLLGFSQKFSPVTLSNSHLAPSA